MSFPRALDYDSGPPLERERFGVWLFLAGETMFFAALIGSYIFLRMGSSNWPSASSSRLHLGTAAFATSALLASSCTAALAVRAARQEQPLRARRWLLITLTLGLLFLGVQAAEWRELVAGGIRPSTDLHWSCFFVLTGFHGLHVFVGVLWLAWVRHASTVLRLDLAALYWHFVDLVWVVLFVGLYLI